MSATSHHRWFQFTIRSVLVLMTVVAVGFGLWVSQFHRRQQALSALRGVASLGKPPGMVSIGGPQTIRFEYPPAAIWLYRQNWLQKIIGCDFFDEPVEITLTAAPSRHGGRVSDADLRTLRELQTVKRLSLDLTDVGEQGMPYLRGLTNLEQLNVAASKAGDDALANMAKLSKLARLDLSDTLITDTGLPHLANLSSLGYLNLQRTKVTDHGARWLKNLVQLKYLNLNGTALTDDGLEGLPSAPRLKRLNLNDTAVTDKGLKRLAECKSLEVIELRGTKITGKTLRHLRTLPRLSYLNLCNTQINDDDVDALNEMRSLVSVSLLGTRVTEKGFNRLRTGGSFANEPVDHRTMDALSETTELDFIDQQFDDVVGYLSERHDVEIQIDGRIPHFPVAAFEEIPRVTSWFQDGAVLEGLERSLAHIGMVVVYRYSVPLVMARPVGPAVQIQQFVNGQELSVRLNSALSELTELDVAYQPLSDILDYFSQRQEIRIRIDHEALRLAGIAADLEVTRAIKGVPLRSALGLILEPLDLTIVAEGDELVIRPAPMSERH